ncbi:unnamed protein product [Rotaria magnacalcarata]|uniref:Uncharacterized protein n=2 Tax=Rotaria magnacalcarata TaxID=392030 RepID=A0A814LUI8_9BILA|nr:unnamed protein product [Rotaria magnacalcarata]
MGCSNARLLVQRSLSEQNATANLNTNNPLNPLSATVATSNETSPIGIATDTNNVTTRMHLTGVDLVVERNGSYTLLLTPKTHKELMPYVLRKKRFRILVDKSRSEGTSTVNVPLAYYQLTNKERIMESDKDLKLNEKKSHKKQSKEKMESTIESIQQVATNELDKVKARFIGGRSIDRGNPEDENENIQSDDEGMIEEIVTTVEEDKDLECKVKKKIETKKTVAQDPETHNKITKVVKTEVTEITRTITINDQHDLERAKRELGIDDVSKLLSSAQVTYNTPSTYHTSSSSWMDQPRSIQVQEKYYDPSNEIVTSGDFPSDSPIKQQSSTVDINENETKQDQTLADATTVGRGPVVETLSSPSLLSPTPQQQQQEKATISTATTEEQKPKQKKTKKKKSSLNLCSCTRNTTTDYDEEQRKQKAVTIIEQKSKQKKKASVTTTNAVLTSTNLQAESLDQSSDQGAKLISDDIKQLINDKKSLLIDYIHLKMFLPSKLFTSKEQDLQGRKISSHILDLLNHDRCSSWTNLLEQVKTEYSNELSTNGFIQPMVKTYEDLFTSKQSNLLNIFSTMHNEKDIKNLPDNIDYITIVQTYMNERDDQSNIDVIAKPLVENIEGTRERLQNHGQSDQKVIDNDHEKQLALAHTKEMDITNNMKKPESFYNEEQLIKMLAAISLHKPITLAEAIAYEYIDLDDPKLGLSTDTTQRMKSLFRPTTVDDESSLNLIRIKRSGEYLTDINLSEIHSFEKFNLSQPFIYQLQQSFEPTLDLSEKQFRSLTETILNNKDEYSNLQFDIGRLLIPADDMKESSTNDFSQSDSGYSMTTATYESLASKVKNEFETISEPITDQINESDKTIDQSKLSNDIHLDGKHSNDIITETVQQTIENLSSELIVTRDKTLAKSIHLKKRKSTGLFSCFGNKKAKASIDQPIILSSTTVDKDQQIKTSIEEKPVVDYTVLPDGKRIYIDVFRNRPGLDMSYKPNDFDTQFVFPVTKCSSDYERSSTPEKTDLHLIANEEKPIVSIETQLKAIEPMNIQSETSEDKLATIQSVVVQTIVNEETSKVQSTDLKLEITEHKSIAHLEARSPTIESVDVQYDATSIVTLLTKIEEATVSKPILNLHGAGIDLPEVELVKPGPLPVIVIATKEKTKKVEKTPKVKKSSGVGLCASCFGAKAAEKKKKEAKSENVQAPIEKKKTTEQEKIDDTSKTQLLPESTAVPVLPSISDQQDTSTPAEVAREQEQIIINLPKLDDHLDVTIEKLVLTEEPHYQEPSGELVQLTPTENEYSLPDANTYDTPRLIETTTTVEVVKINTEEKIVTNEISTEIPSIEIKTSVNDIIPTEVKLESTIATATAEAMPNVEIDESTKKGSYTLPTKKSKAKKTKEPKVKPEKESKAKPEKEPKVKTERKSGLFSTLFRHSDRKSNVPALNLPSYEQNLTTNEDIQQRNSHDIDPLHVPSIDLPKLDVPLPTYDRPEVDMTSGQLKQSSEFSIPVVDLPPIPNLDFPDTSKPTIDLTVDPLKVPNIELPELQLALNEEENIKLPDIHLQNELEKSSAVSLAIDIKESLKTVPLPTITDGLTLASPINNIISLQSDEQNFTAETNYDIKTDSLIPELPKLPFEESEVVIKPELLSNEQKYTITDTHFVQPPELPILTTKQTIEDFEVSTKVPDFSFEIPSTETLPVLSKDINSSLPSFENDVQVDTSKIFPAVEISTQPIKSTQKQVIESKADIKKKSSTLALCSCFSTKSKALKEKQKDKTKTIAAPQTNLPAVDIQTPSSNISSTLKTKGSLRAPTNDLPAIDLTLPSVEPIRLPTIQTIEKKRQAPKKPTINEEIVVVEPVLTVPELVLPTATVNDVDIQQTIEVKSEEVLTQAVVLEKQIPVETSNISSLPIAKAIDEQINAETSSSAVDPSLIENIKLESAAITSPIEKQSVEVKDKHVDSKKVLSFEIKAPAIHIPELDLSGLPKADAYKVSIKQEESSQSCSDSGLEAIVASHIHPSSTFDTNQTIENVNQHLSTSSGLGSEIADTITTKDLTLPDIQQENLSTESKSDNSLLKHDFTRKITMNDELRAKLLFRESDLKKSLETEISKSIVDFDTKKDQKALNKILKHAIDLVKDKKVTTYPELKQKLIVEHKNDAFIVDPVVRSLYFTIENQGLDNIDKPEFPLAIRDMVRHSAKRTFDTVKPSKKEVTSEPTPISPEQPTTRSWLTCGRSKSKPKVPSTKTTTETAVAATTQVGLLDDRRRTQLNTHRNELGNILRDHIQSSQPPIRQFPEHLKETDKIIRKSLTLVNQPKILSYEQIRNDLKTEYKQTFYLVDPVVDIMRDTFDHCDITQMNEKINLDILDSNITQTANLYNQVNSQANLLTTQEHNLLKSNQLQWLNQYLIDNESKDKKITKKQSKELHQILDRSSDLLSLNVIYTWDELSSQLRREFPKAHDLCDRSIELIKKAQNDGLLLLQQSPNSNQQDVTSINVITVNGKRRTSSLLTDRAKQNIHTNRKKIVSSIATLLHDYNKPLYTENQIETYVNKTFHHLEEKKIGEFKTYNDLKERLKKDFNHNHEKLIEQIVDVIEQAHATNQFDDIDKPEVQTLLKDRLDGKPLVIKEMYVSLPPRVGAYGASKYGNDDSSRYLSTSINGDQTMNSSTSSHRVARGLSWREANERARILFYRGKHPAIHYDEQAAGFDVRMLLETTAGGTQEIPVTDSDVHELLNSCGVQWDGVNIISLVEHSDDVVRAAEQAALKVIREKGLVDLRTPPSTRNTDENDEPLSS